MFECATCGYQTKRSFNFNLHNSRKTPCKPKAIVHIDSKDSGSVALDDDNCIGYVSNDSKDSGYSALKDDSNKCYKCSKILNSIVNILLDIEVVDCQ